MFTVQTHLVIAKPPRLVFDFVADQTNAPRWQAGLEAVERLTPGPIRVGSEHAFIRRFAGRRLEARNRFVRYDPGHVVEFEIDDGWMTGRASYQVEPSEGGTLLISTMHFSTRGILRALEPILRWALGRDALRDEARLLAILEDRELVPARPQGR